MTQKIVGLIPSRLESTRLPRKALAETGKGSLSELLVRRLQTSAKTLDDLCICTVDTPANRELAEKAADWGIHCNFGKEEDLLANFLEAGKKLGADHFARITGDNPFTDPVYIDKLVQAHLEHSADYSRVDGLPVGATAEIISLKAAQELYESAEDIEALGYLTLYMYDPARFKCLVMDAAEEDTRPRYSLTVDTKQDIELIRALVSAFPDASHGPTLQQIISWLDDHPDQRIVINETGMIKLPGDQETTYDAFAADLAARKAKSQVHLKA